MKAYQIAALVLAAMSSLSLAAPKKAPTELGNVLYIGDSITHGFGAPSYRWALHKIFVDNGISYNEIGIETGNHSKGVEPGALYIGNAFRNVHAAMSSERAYEVSNRKHESQRLDASSVFHWLGYDKDAAGGEVTPIDKRKLDSAPDTCFILLGTNDTLSDYGSKGGIAKNLNVVEKALLDKKKGDLPVIVNALRQKNAKMNIVILTIPTWGEMNSNNTEKDYQAIVKKFNKKLANTFKKETVVDLNQGLVDICCEEKPYRGVAGFFNAGDKLHPTLQGDLIMAGLVARTMGYAGRSAGAPRKAANTFGLQAAALLESATEKENVAAAGEGLSLKAGAKMVAPWPEGSEAAKGFTVELLMNVGNGAAGGWEKEGNVILSLGNGAHSGKLKLAEGYILWNDGTVLYPFNMSDRKVEPLRVMWVPGNELHNVAKGFYVWMGDMLIGEALPDDGAKFSGIGLANVSSKDEVVRYLAANDKPAAPATKSVVKEETLVAYDEVPAEPAAQK